MVSRKRPFEQSLFTPSLGSNSQNLSASRPTTGRTTRTTRTSTDRPRTRARTATSTVGVAEQQIICAVSESRGVAPTVGLAFINMTTTEAVLCQIADNQTFMRTLHKIKVFEPTEILMPHTAVNQAKSKLCQLLEGNLEYDPQITSIPRKYFSEEKGVEYIHQFAFREEIESLKVCMEGNYFATCCFAAVLSYIEFRLSISFSSHAMRIKFEPSEASMMIDLSTISSLELIQNLQDPKSRDCLFGLLNHTRTPMGSRILRSNILQPSTSANVIEQRYVAVDELVENEATFCAVRQALQPLDIDKALTAIVQIPTQNPARYPILHWEQSINNVILIKQFISSVPPIFEALEGAHSGILKQVRQICSPPNIAEVFTLIDNTINEDTTYQKKPVDLRHQRTNAVKAGVNGLLDVGRTTYKERNEDIHRLVDELSRQHQLTLDLRYDASRQYYLSISAADLEDAGLPDVFINVYKKKNNIQCQTLDLIKLSQKITDSHNEVLSASDRTVQKLLHDIREQIAPLFKICEAIALLDMVASLADVATLQDYCRPELGAILAIKNGRHPLHEKVHNKDKFVPNDVYAAGMSRLQVITGCNMSGKSTYIRSIALMAIMAQIGSFVPAAYASFPIRHQLFARISIDDSATSNISTFAAEMREMAFILHNIDSRSLVVIDELGRGTSTRDGLAIAIAIVEALIQSGSLVWFVTHFRDLPIALAETPGIVNMHLKVDLKEQDRMVMEYKVAGGPVQEQHYGIALAKVAGLPSNVIKASEKISSDLIRRREQKLRLSKEVMDARRHRILAGVNEQLIQAREGQQKGNSLITWLKNLQDEFVRRMVTLDEEVKEAAIISEDEEASDEEMLEEVESVHETRELTTISSGPQQPRESSDVLNTMPENAVAEESLSSYSGARPTRYMMSGALPNIPNWNFERA